MAPRVHNSGHWSIEGAICSQFENHIRAVAGLPLVQQMCSSNRDDQYHWSTSKI
jgi:phosphoribosylaminoimidazole carboxylase (NCAIR synthetase)